MLRVWLAPYGLQCVHIHPAHSNSKDLNAGLPGLSCSLLHCVLRPPISHNHSDSWDVQVCWSCSLCLTEGCLHGVLDGQTCHGSCGKVLHAPHSPLHLSLGGEGVEGEFVLDHAAILEQTDPRGIRTDLKELKQVDDECLDLLVVIGADASGAVDDKDEIQWDAFARVLHCFGLDSSLILPSGCDGSGMPSVQPNCITAQQAEEAEGQGPHSDEK